MFVKNPPAFSPSLSSPLPILRTAASQLLKERPVRILNSPPSHQRTSPKVQILHKLRYHIHTTSTQLPPAASMADQVVHEPEEKRYAIHMEGVPEPAFLRYQIEDSPQGKVYNLTHTYVAPAMRGQGVAAKLVQKAITHAREDNHKIIPTCSYIVAYMQKHEQDRDVVHE